MNRIRLVTAALAATAALAVPAAASAQAPIPPTGDLQTMFQSQAQRSSALEQQIKDQAAAVKARNAQIADLNAQLQKLQSDPGADPAKSASLKAQLDALNRQSQLDMLALQSLVNKQNEVTAAMSAMLKKMADQKAAIIGNMR